ncbi:MAG: TRAP transporter substrate-binding protein [Acetobacteraceae bacterium]
MTTILTRRSVLAGTSAALAGAALPARAEGRTLRLASIAMTNSPWHFAMNKFRDVVHEKTNGTLDVSVYTDGQLGDMSQMMSGLQLGTLDMCYVGASAPVALRGAEVLNILYVPYIFSSVTSAEAICNGEEFNAIYDKVAKATGVRTIGAWGQRSPRALQSIRGPITEPSQVKGLRLRIPISETIKAAFETLGAQIVPMGMLEIYTALSRGTIDGQDNGFDLSVPGHFYEAAKYWSATDHVYELVGWFISERLWQKLSSDEQKAVADAAKQGGQVTTDLTRKLDQDSLNILKANGCNYVVPDRDKFRAALADSHKKFDGKLWPKGMVEHVRATSFT